MTSLYPPDLVPLVQSAWATTNRLRGEKRPPLPASDLLKELLALVYHTSLLREEGRKLLFRIIYLPRGSSKKISHARHSNSRLAVFTEDRSLNVSELRRLAPAADSRRTMICADYDSETGWRVWGLLDTGVNWWQFTRHEADRGFAPPQDLAIGSPGPGEITVSSGGTVLLALRNGSAFLPQGSALNAGPVSTHLEPTRRKLYRDSIGRLKVKKWDKENHDNDYPKRFHDMCLSRILSGIRELAHGGTLLVVPNQLSASDPRLADRVNIKHPCDYDYLWELMLQHLELHHKYYALHFPLWDSEVPIDPEKYHQISILESAKIDNDEALKDAVRFIASLSAVDGALVITDRFRVLGFGAEVIAQSPTLREVQLAMNPEATTKQPVSIEAYGTRHRSAFRFCSTYEDGIAFIVSSDGGVKATKRIGSEVLLWPEVQPSFWDA
ncbi:hypothetical protein IB236_06835 [Acidovorax sp. ACV02]|uniref:putative sensor domain DACNV-containing protein n=1 Tax=Acidovorax sp. ACV02 TaxID=2769310 RepID=UPI00177F3CE5|nr:hypothetical protein [Acidovorax sp. ACV02]MBD9405042.1 hypothetical protein [Acidovorax sp. ACV02]